MTGHQKLVPGIIGLAPATDHVYVRELHRVGGGDAGGGLVNALRTLFATIDTEAYLSLERGGRSDEADELIAAAARALRDGGADFLVVTSNTGSLALERAADVELPVLDIFACAVAETARIGARRPGLVSTRRTLGSGRYQALAEPAGIAVLAPPEELLDPIDAMISREAIRGIQTAASRELLERTVRWFADHGADAVILGCTDLVHFGPDELGQGLLPVVDSTVTHARAAAARALTGS